jgi:polysaccharide biosynthesis PFTS motif protein
VQPLATAQRLIVQSARPRRSSTPETIRYARFPLLAVLHGASVGAGERAGLFLRHAFLPLRFIAHVIRRPVLGLLGRDAALVPLIDWLDRHGLLAAVILTNSAASRQELWLRETHRRKFRSHMVWYSQNTIPLVFAADRLASDYPGYRHVRVDVHWLWTAEYADYLRHLAVPGDLRVVGPILWYLPEPAAPVPPDEIRIAVFDVTPVRDEVAPSIGILANYYCTRNMVRFIEDVVALCETLQVRTGKRVRLMLKHKRSYHPIHDPRYIELIERLSGREQRVELIPFQANMYALLAGSDLSVVVPYSSPAYVASAMGRPAIFHDVSAQVVPTHLPAAHVSFVAGREQLLARALAALHYADAAVRS